MLVFAPHHEKYISQCIGSKLGMNGSRGTPGVFVQRNGVTRMVIVFIQFEHSFCLQGRPESTAHHGHLLSARVVVHHDLLDLEDGILLRRAGSPALVAIPISFVSIALIILKAPPYRQTYDQLFHIQCPSFAVGTFVLNWCWSLSSR